MTGHLSDEEGLTNMKKVILSLFDLTGHWSDPYRVNGYEVIQVEIQNGIDILTWDYKQIDKDSVHGILAAVPCTDYAVSGARWFAEKDKDGRTAQSQKLVEKTREIIEYFDPVFWVIENPVSRIHKLNPWMGNPKMYFHPYEYAGYGFDEERYTKKTGLWGKFNEPIKKTLEPYHTGDYGKIHYPRDKNGKAYGWNTIECKNARSATPKGFAQAFYESNNDDKG
jgi:hypothetical protein